MKKLGDQSKETTKNVVKGFEEIKEIGQAAFAGIERAIDQFANTGKIDFAEMARSILADMAAVIAKGAILGQLLGVNQYSSSNGAGGYTAGILEGVIGSFMGPSYDGGGFTGMGSRSGGVDGKGGFPAILHPNETIVDHSRGQGMGGPVTINQTNVIRETMPSGVASAITRAASQQAVAEMLSISQRGGQRRKSFAFG